MPVIGVVEPGARAAVAATTRGHIGVIGTVGTIKSGAYERAIRALDPDVRVTPRACPLFVPLVEEGWTDHEATRLVAAGVPRAARRSAESTRWCSAARTIRCSSRCSRECSVRTSASSTAPRKLPPKRRERWRARSISARLRAPTRAIGSSRPTIRCSFCS